MDKEYKSIKFSKDKSVQDYIVEWWYFNGHLKNKNGNEYSFMDCLFVELDIATKIDNQEMLFGSINYWEGPLLVSGNFSGEKVNGVGFMELVGYPSRYTNVKYQEVRPPAGFSQLPKNKAFNLVGSLKNKIAE